MPDLVLACRDCGQIHRAGVGLPQRRWLLCRRCGARLWQLNSSEFDVPLAFAATAAILFVPANTFPLFDISLAGDDRSTLILNGAVALSEYGDGISVVGALVVMTSAIIPALSIALIIVTLARLRATARVGALPGLRSAGIWRVALRLRRWSMLDVYLLGTIVAYTRLGQLGQVVVAAGGYALAALVLVQVSIEQSLGRQRVWDAIGDPVKYSPTAGDPWVLCLECDLVVARMVGDGDRQRCPRCSARLEWRRPGSLAITAALTASGFILYLPANLFPMLTITRFGRTQSYTILGGVHDLAAAGLWPLALLVLVASIIVPVLKLGGLTWCLIAIRLRSARALRQRTALYRFIDFIGRWSNIDVFMISTVTALVQFGTITTIEPGPAVVSFAALVALTMVASGAFDPRLMWDAAAGVRQG
jgi:paraquat-inducible protein A